MVQIGHSYTIKSIDRASVDNTFRRTPAPDWALGKIVTVTGWCADGHTAICSIVKPESPSKSMMYIYIHEDDLGYSDESILHNNDR